MLERKLIVIIGERKTGAMTPISVEFEGDYIVKKELDLIIRTIKGCHRKIIRDHRRKVIIADYEAKKNVEVETKKDEVVEDGTNGSGSSEPTDRRSADSGSGQDESAESGTVQSGDGNAADATDRSNERHAAEADSVGESGSGSKISSSILAAIAKSKASE